MQDSYRKSYIPLVLFGALAVGATATFKVGRSLLLTGAQLDLNTSGTGAGGTSAIVYVNGVAVTPALSVAGAAAAPLTAYQDATASAGRLPKGFGLKAGDIVTVVITAVPATTVPAGAVVYLDVTQVDVS